MLVYSKKILLAVLFILALLPLMAQQDVSMRLQINNKEKLSVYCDEPLLIALHISNPKASADEQWNREAEGSLSELQEQHRNQKIADEKFTGETQQIEGAKKKIQTIVWGSNEIPVYHLVQVFCINITGDTLYIPLKLLNNSSIPVQFILDANAYYTLQWGIDRVAIQKLSPGKYFFTTTFGDYHSNSVELIIQPGSIPALTLHTVSMQSALGRFALTYGRPDSAIIHAKTILKTHPSSLAGLVLLGDAYIHKKNYDEALKSFQSALRNFKKQYPHSSEPPEYILGMIEQLKVYVKSKP
jgi:tetratricopeptide (TPR) repeat protein